MGHLLTMKRLRRAQLFLVTFTGICSLTSGMAVATVDRYFDWHCPLYLQMLNISYNAPNKTVLIKNAKWGSRQICYFATYEGVGVFITSLICFLFLVQLDSDVFESFGSSQNQDAAFILPLMIINSFLLVCTVVCTGYISKGLNDFCANLNITSTNPPGLKDVSCEDLQDSSWHMLSVTSSHPKDPVHFHSYLTAAASAGWIVAGLLIAQLVLICLEVYFRLSPYSDTSLVRPDDQRVTAARARRYSSSPNVGFGDESISQDGSVEDIGVARVASAAAARRWRSAAAAVPLTGGLQADRKQRQTVVDSLRQIRDYHESCRRATGASAAFDSASESGAVKPDA